MSQKPAADPPAAATSVAGHVSAESHAANFSPKQRSIALVVVAFAFVMDLLDSTIVNIAIPSIQSNLSASYAAIQWLVAGYSLFFALLLVTGGRMGDVFGYKKLFMVGVGGFTLASLLCGVAWNPTVLIIARLIQGSMAALMVPQVMSLMQVMYAPEERGKINGLFGALGGMAASLGPIIGGVLIKANLFGWDWRPVFLINVPVGIFALIAASKFLPNGKSSHPLKLDISGTIIIIVAMLLLIYPLIQGRELGWPVWSIVSIIASLPVFGYFAYWQRRKERLGKAPLIQPALFHSRSFSVGMLVNLIFETVMVGFFLTFGLMLQIGLGFSPLHAALTGLPIAFAIAMTMAAAGDRLPKLGRRAIFLGVGSMAVGLAITGLIFQHYTFDTHSWQLIPGLLFVGVGMGLVFSSLFAAVLNGVDRRHAGSASGTLNAVQQVGAAVGIAVIGIIFFGQLSHAATDSFAKIEPQLRQQLTASHVPAEAQGSIIQSARDCFVDRSRQKDSSDTPASCKPAASTDRPQAQVIAAVTQAALKANATNFAHAFAWSVGFAAAMLAVTFGMTFLLPKRFRAEAYQEAA